jgi:hypothetical protein
MSKSIFTNLPNNLRNDCQEQSSHRISQTIFTTNPPEGGAPQVQQNYFFDTQKSIHAWILLLWQQQWARKNLLQIKIPGFTNLAAQKKHNDTGTLLGSAFVPGLASRQCHCSAGRKKGRN